MHFEIRDFNEATTYFGGQGATEWEELAEVFAELTPHFQASGQAGRLGRAIFDPKGTNAALTLNAKRRGWASVPVPEKLTMFGVDWDAGKGATLAEWQFSNYPFLWNNVIRTQAVVSGGVHLAGVSEIRALVVVTKSGSLPASNSTLYFEQAEAQLDAVFRLGAFSLPVRLVGLDLEVGVDEVDAIWSTYSGRYGRVAATRKEVRAKVSRASRASKYGVTRCQVTLP